MWNFDLSQTKAGQELGPDPRCWRGGGEIGEIGDMGRPDHGDGRGRAFFHLDFDGAFDDHGVLRLDMDVVAPGEDAEHLFPGFLLDPVHAGEQLDVAPESVDDESCPKDYIE